MSAAMSPDTLRRSDSPQSAFSPDQISLLRHALSVLDWGDGDTSLQTWAHSAMRPLKPMTERQKRWINTSQTKKSSPSRESARSSGGTILKAVPRAASTTKTPLDVDGPRDDTELFKSRTTSTHPITCDLDPVRGHGLSMRRLKAFKKRVADGRIGIWRNGVFLWDDSALKDPTGLGQSDVVVLRSSTAVQNGRAARPNLTVVIPDSSSLLSDAAITDIVQSAPLRPSSPLVPTALIPGSCPRTAMTSTDECFGPLPLEEAGMPYSLQPEHAVISADAGDPVDPDTSRPSCSSSSSGDTSATENDSGYSANSSTTSVDRTSGPDVELSAVSAREAVARASQSSLLSSARAGVSDTDLNKPLPPPPAALALRRRTCDPSSITTVCDRRSSESERLRGRRNPSGRSTGDFRPVSAVTVVSKKPSSRFDQLDDAFLRSCPYNGDARVSKTTRSGHSPNEPGTAVSPTAPPIPPRAGITEARPSTNAFLREQSVRSVMQPPSRVPTVPKRSRKREWQAAVAASAKAAPEPPSVRRRRSDSDISGSTEVVCADPQLPAESLRKTRSWSSTHDMIHVEQTDGSSSVCVRRDSMQPSLFDVANVDDGLILNGEPTTLRQLTYRDYAEHAYVPSPEDILVPILAALPTLRDLFSTAATNRGLHRVYKTHEMALVRRVLFNESPAAWELREWSRPRNSSGRSSPSEMESGSNKCDPGMYLRRHYRDVTVISSLKKAIVEKCGAILRSTTAAALSDPKHPQAQRCDNAFYRIWSFCRIFGANRGRDSDLAGQLHWLRGGLRSDTGHCTTAMRSSVDYDMSDLLLNAPSHFAVGNRNGLAYDDLYDIAEVWTCMSALLGTFHGRTEAAREAGVYRGCGVVPGDEEKEEQVLAEWICYLLTLGPSVVLDMAEFAASHPAEGFAYANAHGWTNWQPPSPGATRELFLTGAISRVLQEWEKPCAAEVHGRQDVKTPGAICPDGDTLTALPRSRQRVNTAETKLPRDVSPMSRRNHAVSRINSIRRKRSIQAMMPFASFRHQPVLQQTKPLSGVAAVSKLPPHPALHSELSPDAAVLAQLLPDTPVKVQVLPQSPAQLPSDSPMRSRFVPAPLFSSSQALPHSYSPVHGYVAQVAPPKMLPADLQFFHGVAEDTSELAIKSVISFGFTPDEARNALRETDTGDGLRVDRAVGLLLSRQCTG